MAFSLQDAAVQSYIVYSAILALKLLALSTLTGMKRMSKKVFANPEDAAALKGKVNLNDPEVERVRRAHLNDLENIPAFWLLGALYVTTAPVAAWATLLFRVYTVSRFIHTFVYAVVPMPQPARGIAYGVPYLIKWYMGIQVILHYAAALSYIVYSAILALKLIAVSTLTSMKRLSRKVYANPEDAAALKGKVNLNDPEVERVRRAHLNDLENIPAFWLLGALYVTTGPVATWATFLFRVYTISRLVHTFVYAIVPMPQPARGMAFGVPYLIKWYMGIQVILHYATAL
ncbi:uncharacterized protein LOC125225302 [Leguminivora glycinivorella]|uniref:uncharacterized protein LOC125225302 n=1 Tax=Leguminivora glycinivorella TaxID=1035111 RepID=UPI00200C8941|nr:uncharacterized protein LOC125225302 [Leguminivora glycinivorella]